MATNIFRHIIVAAEAFINARSLESPLCEHFFWKFIFHIDTASLGHKIVTAIHAV